MKSSEYRQLGGRDRVLIERWEQQKQQQVYCRDRQRDFLISVNGPSRFEADYS